MENLNNLPGNGISSKNTWYRAPKSALRKAIESAITLLICFIIAAIFFVIAWRYGLNNKITFLPWL